jgi:hypothetical protein
VEQGVPSVVRFARYRQMRWMLEGLVDFEFLWLLGLARALPIMSLYGLLFYIRIGHAMILRPQGTCLM